MPRGKETRKCPTCQGTGKTKTIVHGGRGVWERECPVCDGKGKITTVDGKIVRGDDG
jgi:DnaJ-class molecular chaperone